MSVASLARRLGGRYHGSNWRCPCPLDCGYMLSLCDGKDGKLLAHCFGGCEFNSIITALVEYGLLDDMDGAAPLDVGNGGTIRRRDDDVERIALARQIYGCSALDERVARYLRSRGITVTSPVLRFNERAPHRLGIRLPAMIAPVVRCNRRVERSCACRSVRPRYCRPCTASLLPRTTMRVAPDGATP